MLAGGPLSGPSVRLVTVGVIMAWCEQDSSYYEELPSHLGLSMLGASSATLSSTVLCSLENNFPCYSC